MAVNLNVGVGSVCPYLEAWGGSPGNALIYAAVTSTVSRVRSVDRSWDWAGGLCRRACLRRAARMLWVNRARMTNVVPVVTASRAPAVVRAVSMAIVPMESDVCHDRMAKGVLLEHVSRTGHEHPLVSDRLGGLRQPRNSIVLMQEERGPGEELSHAGMEETAVGFAL